MRLHSSALYSVGAAGCIARILVLDSSREAHERGNRLSRPCERSLSRYCESFWRSADTETSDVDAKWARTFRIAFLDRLTRFAIAAGDIFSRERPRIANHDLDVLASQDNYR